MIRFLFWNLNKKPLTDSIARIVKEHQIDVLIFAECQIDPNELLEHLKMESKEFHYAPSPGCKKITVFTRFSDQFLTPVREDGRVSIRRLNLPASEEILIAMAHLPSKLYHSGESQAMELSQLSQLIQDEEERLGHSRTLLVGDMNMNPFETGMTAAGGLHAVMSRKVVKRERRTVQQRSYPFFYNPMWGHFGDRDDTPAGTFYYERAEQVNYFWNLFDQVLLRPALLSAFRSNELEILSHDGMNSLLSEAGQPDTSFGSDHLPIVFILHI